MKRVCAIPYIIFMLAFLAGCSSNIYSSHRDMERLRPIQTLGLDREGEGVVVSVSSGIGPKDSPPLVMKTIASSMETAIDRLQDYSPKDELFYAHVEYILIGETMSDDGIGALLNWVERSPTMRIDTAAFLVKGNAHTAVTASAGETADITERLASLEREQLARGQRIYTLREIATALADRGSALCLAIEAVPSQGTVYTEHEEAAAAILPAGYGVLRDGELAAYLSQNETLGAQLLEDNVVGAQATVNGNVLEFYSSTIQPSGQWDGDGNLTGLLLTGNVRAGVLEQAEPGGQDIQTLEADFTQAVRQWLEAVVARSQALSCDFLDLEYAVVQDAPKNSAGLDETWDELFPALPVTILAEGQIDRSYDLSN